MDKKISNSELSTFRPVLNAYGCLYGKVLVQPTSDNLDLTYKDKVKAGLRHLNTPMLKFMTKVVTITKMELIKNANDKVMLVINDDSNLQFPVTSSSKPKIMECSAAAVNDALVRFRETNEPTFFADFETVNKVITDLNEQTAKECEEMADELMNFSSSLRSINATEKQNLEDYKKSLNL